MRDKKGFKAVFLREICRIPKFKGIVALITILPIVVTLFFVSLFSANSPSSLPVAVVDHDNSTLSRKSIRMIDATPAVEVVSNIKNELEAVDLMKKGKVDAILIIPKDMERSVYRGESVEVPLFVSGMKILNASLIYKDIFTTMSTFSSGIEIQYLMKGGLSEADAYQKMMPIYYEKHQLFNPYTSYSYYLLPAFILILIAMFSIISAIFFIGIELKRNSAKDWIDTAGGSIIKAVMGKLLPYTILFFTLLMGLYYIMFGVLGQPFNGNTLFMLFVSLVYVLASQAFGVIVISLLGNLGLSTSIGAGFSIMAFSFSGLTFTLEAMYGFVRVLSNFFPYKHYMKIFVDNTMRGAAVELSIYDLLWLICFCVVALILTIRLKKISLSGKFKEIC